MNQHTMPLLRFSLFLALLSVFGLSSAGCDFRQGAEDLSKADPNRGLTGGRLTATYNFETDGLDPKVWNNTAGPEGWVVADGWLHSSGTHNKALWLRQPLPENVRVEFDAKSGSPQGDIKAEIFGDGARHESGYVMIFGGWKNSINTIARLDEHGADRVEGAADVRVKKDQVYRHAIVRTDRQVRWFVDGKPFLTFDDAAPLTGPKHAHFGFNDWAVPLYFDNLSIYDLGSQ